MVVVGIEKVDYTNKKGNRVQGFRYHCTFERKEIAGVGVETLYCSGEQCAEIGDKVRPLYNRFGNIEEIYVEEEIKK